MFFKLQKLLLKSKEILHEICKSGSQLNIRTILWDYIKAMKQMYFAWPWPWPWIEVLANWAVLSRLQIQLSIQVKNRSWKKKKTDHGSSGNKPQAGHWHGGYSSERKKRGELNPFSFSLLKMSAANHKEKPQMGEALVLRGDNEELMQIEEVRIS